MIGFDLFLHLLLDLLEIVRRNPVRELDVVIEPVLDRWSGCELRVGPDFQNRSGQNVSGRMPQTFNIGHLGSLL